MHDRLKTVIIENLDWAECIDRYDRPASFMYLDPPYPGNGANYKHNMRSIAEHSTIAERLGQVKCKWMLSSYDTEEVRDQFRNYNIIPIQSSSGMRSANYETRKHGRKRTINREVLILNYDPSAQGGDATRREALGYTPDQAALFESSASYNSSSSIGV